MVRTPSTKSSVRATTRWATNCPEYKVTAVQVRARASASLAAAASTMLALAIDADAEATPQAGEHATRGDLVRMSNQIAANFAHHPPEQAAGEVATHIKRFWPPNMPMSSWRARTEKSSTRWSSTPWRYSPLRPPQ